VAMASMSARVTPVAMSTLRLVIATLLLPFLLLASGQAHELGSVNPSQVAALVGSGLLAYAIGDTLYIASLPRLGVQRAFTITMALFITFTVGGGIVFLGEEVGLLQLLGALLVGAGIIVLTRARRTAAGALAARTDFRGYAIVVVVAAFWAAATLWLAGGRGDLGSISASMLRTPAGAVGMMAFACITAPADLKAPLKNRGSLLGVTALAVFGTLLGSLLYVYAVGEAGASRTTILNATSPLLALPLSVIVLKEPFTRLAALGTVIAVAGIVLVVA
jgi:drug/metabolite transporter (DMT)-like permease